LRITQLGTQKTGTDGTNDAHAAQIERRYQALDCRM
jgi:hypothetical protein